MSESLLNLNPDKQHDIFLDIELFLQKNGFEKISLEELALERKALGISAPTKKRQKEGDECVVFRKPFMSGYFLEVIPRFNERTKTFTSYGQVTVHVKKMEGHERIFGIYFKKWDGMKERVETVSGFLARVLQKHPRNENGRYMTLMQSPKNKWRISFIDPEYPKSISKKKNLLSKYFLEMFPAREKEILEIFGGRIEYVSTKPKDVQDLSDLVHRRKTKKPENSVPAEIEQR